ncbi:MAG: MFS transporter [Planctomycetota bacterium]|jgi:MFS family permease
MLWLLAVVELLAMTLWFSASAVAPQMAEQWQLGDAGRSWLTIAVQLGFVVGALGSAVLNLADRFSPQRLIACSALLGALFNVAIAFWAPPLVIVLAMRFLTGMTLAGVYPPGMKLLATWFNDARGLAIGIMVAALATGSAAPHLMNALTEGGVTLPPWQPTVYGASVLAAIGAIVAGTALRTGPLLQKATRFHWRHAGIIWTNRPVRLANFGYLGHMWELYAVWTWAPLLLLESYASADGSATVARTLGFALIAAGSVGSVIAGALADRVGRTLIASGSLAVSGACALGAGFLFDHPTLLTIVCLVWGLAVVADSAQFSTAVSELADPRYVGTALTMQTCTGFLLTFVTIRLTPPLVQWLGWGVPMALLALGPVFGIWSMIALRRLPEATKMASGNR